MNVAAFVDGLDWTRVAVVLLCVGAAYLAGNFPSATLVGRLVGRDPTKEGSRNPGASNVYRIAGANAGALVLFLDIAKGLLPTLVALAIGGRPLAVACGAAAVVGHIFPATRSFRGGKGVATFGGMTLSVWFLPAVLALIVWVVMLKLFSRASVAAIVAAPLVALAVWALGGPGWEVASAVALVALVVARHKDNIARLFGGNELTV